MITVYMQELIVYCTMGGHVNTLYIQDRIVRKECEQIM